jgi:hypothetical protein
MGHVCQPTCSDFVKVQHWKHDFSYPLICEQAVLGILWIELEKWL